MQGWLGRAALAAALGLGVVAGLARAQVGVIVTPQPYPTFQQQEVVVTSPQSGLGGGVSSYGVQAPPSTAGSPYPVLPNMLPAPAPPMDGRGPVKEWLNHHNLCCWSHHNCMGCSSFKSDFTFFFGSCRTFFGEPCPPGPPPPPWAHTPGYAPGYAPRGCGCE